MRSDRDLLFYNKDLSDVLQGYLDSAQQYVEKIPQDQFLGTDDDTLSEYVFSDMEVQPIVLYEDRMEMEQTESKMDVSGDYRRNPFNDGRPIIVPSVRVTVTIPFSGCKELWYLKPSTWRTSIPNGSVQEPGDDGIGQLNLVIERPADCKPQEYKSAKDSAIGDIHFYLGNQQRQLAEHHNALRNKIREAMARRRKHLEQHDAVRKMLDIPLKRRSGAPSVEPIRVKRKLVKPLPPAPKSPPEFGIRDEDYTHILNVIRHEGRSYETTPATFAIHDEESLRDIILAHLNGHYEGDAKAEAFRQTGKTDIQIEQDNRAAFIAECKIWRGAKELLKAVDQLLGYLTWRDCKAALILFNKKVAGFSELQTKTPETLTEHSHFLKQISSDQPGEWRFLFRSADDSDRHITVHVFLFNLYVSKNGSNSDIEED